MRIQVICTTNLIEEMNPNEKGWLEKYLTFRKQQLLKSNIPLSPYLSLESGEFLYQLLQPTGLIYGHPVFQVAHPRENEWDENARVKVLMTESFIHCGLYLYPPPDNSEQEIERLFAKVMTDVKGFYHHTFREYQKNRHSVLYRPRTDISQMEYLLDQRIAIKRRFSNFWTGFFHNSLIYLDLIYFVKWAEVEGRNFDFGLAKEREIIRILLLKLIAATANADKRVSTEEKILFNFFLESANLPNNKKKLAKKFIDEKIQLEDIDLSLVRTWVLKKYFLEITILTIRADRMIKDAELEFLGKLLYALNLDEQEMMLSMDAIENFVLEHKPRVHYLQSKQIYRLASERYLVSFKLAVKKNRRRISQEISESKELVALLSKWRKEELTSEEKEKVRKQLIDILKTIPALTIFMLPLGSITLPLLLKILPKKVLYPSSFLED